MFIYLYLRKSFQHKQSEASFVLCCPETAALAAESVRLLSSADGRQVKILCLGKNSAGLTDILPGLEGSDPADAPAPHRAEDPKKEVMALFWSSGTTGTQWDFALKTIS